MFPTDGMEMNFPYARSMVVVRSVRTVKRSGVTTRETRAYLSSLELGERTQWQWHQLVRGHWAGVENRNHWRRDSLFGEDRSRSRHPGLLANLALLRSALLRVLGHRFPGQPLPALFDQLRPNPRLAFNTIAFW